MSEPEVTVNVVASLSKLEESIKSVPTILEEAASRVSVTPTIPLTPTVTQSKIVDRSKGEAAPIQLPNYKNEEVQLKALMDFSDRVAAMLEKAESKDPFSKASESLRKAFDESVEQIEALLNKGVTPSSSKANVPNPDQLDFPSFADPDQQLQALRDYTDQLDVLLQKYEAAGQGGSVAADLVKSKLDFAIQESIALEEQLDKLASKGKKPSSAGEGAKPKLPKPPPLPKTPKPPPLPPDPFKESLGGIKSKAEALSKVSDVLAQVGVRGAGPLGALAGRVGSLSGLLAKLGPTIAAVAAALAVVAVAATAVVVAVVAVSSVIKQAIQTAAEYEKKLVGLANSLGSLSKAKVLLKDVQVVTDGTGIDKNSLANLIPKIEAETRGQLSSREGLQFIANVAAKVDPANVEQIGGAISGAFSTLREGGSVTSFTNRLVELGLISGEAARELEMMQKITPDPNTLWLKLAGDLQETANGAKNANQTLSGLLARLKVSLSNAWGNAMAQMGEKSVAILGPAFEKLVNAIEAILPRLVAGAGFAGEILANTVGMITSVVEAVAFGITAIQGLAKTGKLGELFKGILTLGMLQAANAFINALAVGIQMAVDMLVLPLKSLMNKNFWAALGNILVSIAKMFLGALSGITGLLIGAAGAMLQYIIAGVDFAKDKLTPGKTANFQESLAEAGQSEAVSMVAGAAENALTLSGSAVASALESAGNAASNLFNLGMEEGPMGKFVRGEYATPDILGNSINNSKDKLKSLLQEGFDAMPDPNKKEDKTVKPQDIPALKDVVGEAGPKAVVDSLQSVGGGGLSFGISWQDRMLEETKTQNVKLTDIATNTANAGGVYGGAAGGESPVVILSTISNNVAAILAAIVGKNSNNQNQGVTIRS